ncbi:MAG: YdcF family protein [Clostridia bacterium]|nr:YdcF family protein [Clostridia bacterium]
MFKKMLKLILILILLLIIAYFALFAYVCIAEKTLESPQAADAIIVLGAQVKPDGTPSVQLQYRLETALNAYQTHPLPIVCCGGQAGQEPAPEGAVMKDWLLARGVPEDALIAETASLDTKQNIKNALALLREAGIEPGQVLIVTSDYHVARALSIARDVGVKAYGLPAPTTAEYWLKNRSREALAWGKYLLYKILGR